jgi:hypothetical protein
MFMIGSTIFEAALAATSLGTIQILNIAHFPPFKIGQFAGNTKHNTPSG